MRVQIETVELIEAHFGRLDQDPIPYRVLGPELPEIVVDVDYGFDEDRGILGCLIGFATVFEQASTPPYEVLARFRLLYSVKPGEPLDDEDIQAFAHWNGTFNAWPYWREYLSSTINRAQLPRFVLPVFRVPREPR